jgi:sugar-specific transcriptional regulator TrmB
LARTFGGPCPWGTHRRSLANRGAFAATRKVAREDPRLIPTTPSSADMPADELDPADLGQVRFRKLRELGLTEYQAKAYLALVRLGKGTAAQVAKVTDVPRNKLYPVMQQLNQLGVVETLLGEAQVFRPLPIDRFVAERIGHMRSRVEELDASRGALAAMFRVSDEPSEASAAGYRLYHGRANTVDQVRSLLRGARAVVAIAGGAGTAARMLASGEADLLRQRLDEGVRVQVALPSQGTDAAAARDLDALLEGAVRLVPSLPQGFLLVQADEDAALQAQLQPDDASPQRGNDITLVSQSPILARMVAHVAGEAWRSGQPPAEALAARAASPGGPETPYTGAP